MKSVYSSLAALVVFVVLAPLAIADPGATWERQINSTDRFQVLSEFSGFAVFDNETGRVWEQQPSQGTMQSTWVLTIVGRALESDKPGRTSVSLSAR